MSSLLTLRRCCRSLLYSERGCELPKSHLGACTSDWRLLGAYVGKLRRVLFVALNGKPDWIDREGWRKDVDGVWRSRASR